MTQANPFGMCLEEEAEREADQERALLVDAGYWLDHEMSIATCPPAATAGELEGGWQSFAARCSCGWRGLFWYLLENASSEFDRHAAKDGGAADKDIDPRIGDPELPPDPEKW